ncbi:threonylcarbamoyl-AMP synthase [Candidatus Kaiserbacteria bacterium]|nr:threonylcarbamoyl-AMP synthase [Candidatus Kaiserbacteria bacterium]
MRVVKLTPENLGQIVEEAAGVLRSEGVILYPTDTLYGLGADAFSDDAIAKIHSIKGRDESKPIHCVVTDLSMAGKYGEFNETARRLAKEFFPGALTLVVEKKEGIKSGIARDIETIGFRIPRNDFCIALAHTFEKPYTTTSANVSGEVSERSIKEVLAQLGTSAEEIGLIIDAGTLPPSAPSTVVGVSGEDAVILREGAIPTTEIFESLGQLLPERENL